ncbi:MAG: adenylate/guanylate cyclase domain-containing response regulator, partial [Burkholderiales bacterium]
IGNVTNLAARLCAEANAGEVLLCQRTMASIDEQATLEPVGPLTLRGFAQPVPAFRVKALK